MLAAAAQPRLIEQARGARLRDDLFPIIIRHLGSSRAAARRWPVATRARPRRDRKRGAPLRAANYLRRAQIGTLGRRENRGLDQISARESSASARQDAAAAASKQTKCASGQNSNGPPIYLANRFKFAAAAWRLAARAAKSDLCAAQLVRRPVCVCSPAPDELDCAARNRRQLKLAALLPGGARETAPTRPRRQNKRPLCAPKSQPAEWLLGDLWGAKELSSGARPTRRPRRANMTRARGAFEISIARASDGRPRAARDLPEK